MESLANTACFALACFLLMMNTRLAVIKLSDHHNYFNNLGVGLSLTSVVFKIYLFKLSFNDYFEYELFNINKEKFEKKFE